jgi:hypothetical protein
VEPSARRPSLGELDATDLDQAMTALDFEAGGFGVEDDLAHERRGARDWG